MVIAECRYCGARRYSFEEQDAIEKLQHHTCSDVLTDRELSDILAYVTGKRDFGFAEGGELAHATEHPCNFTGENND